MGRQENIDLAKRFYKSLEDGDLETYFSLLTPDCEIRLAGNTPVSGVAHGTEEIQKLLTDVFACMDVQNCAFGCEYRIVVADDDGVAALTHGGGLTAIGRQYNQTYANVFKMRDGKIYRFYEFLDTVLTEDAFYDNQLQTPRTPIAKPLNFLDEPII